MELIYSYPSPPHDWHQELMMLIYYAYLAQHLIQLQCSSCHYVALPLVEMCFISYHKFPLLTIDSCFGHFFLRFLAKDKAVTDLERKLVAAESQMDDHQARLSDANNQRRRAEDELNVSYP